MLENVGRVNVGYSVVCKVGLVVEVLQAQNFEVVVLIVDHAQLLLVEELGLLDIFGFDGEESLFGVSEIPKNDFCFGVGHEEKLIVGGEVQAQNGLVLSSEGQGLFVGAVDFARVPDADLGILLNGDQRVRVGFRVLHLVNIAIFERDLAEMALVRFDVPDSHFLVVGEVEEVFVEGAPDSAVPESGAVQVELV